MTEELKTLPQTEDCWVCKGEGWVDFDVCIECKGIGVLEVKELY